MRFRTGWMLILAFLCSCLLEMGLATTTGDDSTSANTPSPTPAPASSSSSSSSSSSTSTTSSGATPSPTSPSSSSSGTSRGTVVAWALFTMLVAVGLMVFLYSREQNSRRRIHDGESLRQSLSSADAMQMYGQQGGPPGQGSDPVMSSF
eukprot:g5628.t1